MKWELPSTRGLAIIAITASIAIGLVHILLYAAQHGGSVFLSVVSVAASASAASLAVGVVLGFLFGIPRTLQQDTRGQAPLQKNEKPSESDGASNTLETRYRANTNLEDISDWLTKILVGVGLTQLSTLSSRFNSLASNLARGLGVASSDYSFAFSIIVYFALCGFLGGYVVTRLYFPAALRAADAEIKMLSAKVKSVDAKIDDLKTQYGYDADAQSLLIKHLDPHGQAAAQDELDKAVAVASPPIRAKIYYEARDRYKDSRGQDLVSRSVQLFRALIASEASTRTYHMNHGQLGRALIFSKQPNWGEAEVELTKAISLRGDWKLNNLWIFYEFYRALCRINQDSNFLQGQPSSASKRSDILEDLKVANTDYYFGKRCGDNKSVSDWMKLNGVGEEDLRM